MYEIPLGDSSDTRWSPLPHVCPQLSLVDLAGSERVGKTGASAEQLKVSIGGEGTC